MATEHDDDKTVADTFPASDPPANSGITGAEPSKRQERGATHERGDHARPTGTPTSDRHAAETAYNWEDEVKPDRPA
ncbi:MAG: hypothetical protein P4L71_12370 [Acetobacteraceae bacterium]|nr:hypothetical protein [Acetobacteraceae bacterium]